VSYLRRQPLDGEDEPSLGLQALAPLSCLTRAQRHPLVLAVPQRGDRALTEADPTVDEFLLDLDDRLRVLIAPRST
jgi:hypothetical protein